MKILFVTGEYPPTPGGVGDYTAVLAHTLAGRGHTVGVASIRAGRFVLLHPGEENEAAPQAPGTATWGWNTWRAIASAIDLVRPDVLHIQYQTGAYGMHPAINLLPWRQRRSATRPMLAVTFHDLLEPYLFPKAGPLRRWVTLRLAYDADAAVVTNEADAANLAGAGLAAHRIPIGSNIPLSPPPGYQRDQWRAALGVADSHQGLVAYFGLLSHSKGPDLLLAALRGSAAPPWASATTLLLVGGDSSAPADQVYAAEVAARIPQFSGAPIIRTGQVPAESVSGHLLAADVVALPFRDGASFRRGSLLAALAHGRPVVTTRGGEPQLIHGENCLLVPPNNELALQDAIGELLGNAPLRARIGAGAQVLAAQFGWDAIAAQYEDLYEGLGVRG